MEEEQGPSYKGRNIVGLLVFLGASQFVLCMIISEALQPDYKTSSNYISDLGVGSSSLVFNSSISILGLLILAASYLSLKSFDSRLFSAILALIGFGAVGVGLFPKTNPTLHAISAFAVFFFGAVAAIFAYKFEKAPFSYLSAVMGVLSLASLPLFFFTDFDFGLGPGGIERIVAYPILLWAIAFGGFLMSDSGAQS